MTTMPSRHGKLTSLVGVLLVASVAGSLVTFSLVAQQAARQGGRGAAVRPVAPESGLGPPLDVIDDIDDRPVDRPSPVPELTPDTGFEDLLARAAADPLAPETPRERPRRTPRCDNCDGRDAPRDRDRPERPREEPPAPTDGRPTAPSCGAGHFKGKGEGHEKGRGRGHCEHGGGEATPGDDGDDRSERPSENPKPRGEKSRPPTRDPHGSDHAKGTDDKDAPRGKNDNVAEDSDPPGKSEHPKDEGKDKGKGRDKD